MTEWETPDVSTFNMKGADFGATPYEQWIQDENPTRVDNFAGGGLFNLPANLGAGQDLSQYDDRIAPGYQEQTYFSTFYRTSPFAKRILDLYTQDLYGKGPVVVNLDPDDLEKLNKVWKENQYDTLLRTAIRQMLLHGGCALLLDTQLKEIWKEPLERGELKNHFKYFSLIDKSLMFPSNFGMGADSSTLDLREPKQWTIVQPGLATSFQVSVSGIDKSRFIFFIPEKLPFYSRINAGWWADSIFTTNRKLITSLEWAFHSTCNLLKQSSLRFYKTDFQKKLQTPGVINKAANAFYSSLNQETFSQNNTAHVMDIEDEIISLEVKNLQDQEAALKTLTNYAIAPFGIPLTRFWGNSPAGFSTGDSELLQWYEEIENKREAYLRDVFQKFFNVLSERYNLPSIEFIFKPLSEPNLVQESDIRLKEAQTAAIYQSLNIPMEVILPDMQKRGAFQDLDTDEAKKIGKTIDSLVEVSQNRKAPLAEEDMKDDTHSPGAPTSGVKKMSKEFKETRSKIRD